MTSARAAGLTLCHCCDKLVSRRSGVSHCPRCGAALHARKPNSEQRTWALLIAAYALYVPANMLPVMTVLNFGSGNPDTIFSGMLALMASGLWPLALLVFFASIVVPMVKMLGLTLLLLSVRYRWRWRTRDLTVGYRLIEAVGRWSMIDIFMITIFIALVKLGTIATIEPGAGASSFAAVVVLTMLASISFDPRLLWDASGDNDHE